MVVSDWGAPDVLPLVSRLVVFDAETRNVKRFIGVRGPQPLQLREPYGLRLLRDGRHVAFADTRVDERGSYNVLVLNLLDDSFACAGGAHVTPGAALNRPIDVLEGDGFLVVANFFGDTVSYLPWGEGAPVGVGGAGAGGAGASVGGTGAGGAGAGAGVVGAGGVVPPRGLCLGDSVLQFPSALAYIPGVGLLVRESGQKSSARLILFSGGSL